MTSHEFQPITFGLFPGENSGETSISSPHDGSQTLQEMPLEILSEIFEYLDPRSRKNWRRTCRRFRDFVYRSVRFRAEAMPRTPLNWRWSCLCRLIVETKVDAFPLVRDILFQLSRWGAPLRSVEIKTDRRKSRKKLVGNKITRALQSFRGTLKSLRLVSLGRLTERGIVHISGLEGLTELDLSRNNLGREIELLSSLTNLRSLDISRNMIIPENMRRLSSLTKLRTLSLSANFNALRQSEWIGRIFPSLETVDISSGGIATPSDIERLGRMSALQRLNLGTTMMMADSASLLALITRLKALSLPNNLIDNVSLRSFAALTSLTSLDLSRNLLDARCGGTFARFPLLEELDVSDNPILDDAVDSFVVMRNLRLLNLSSTGITDRATVALSRLSSLKDLDLSRNHRLGCFGVRRLTALPELTSLNLLQTDIDRASFFRLPFTGARLTVKVHDSITPDVASHDNFNSRPR